MLPSSDLKTTHQGGHLRSTYTAFGVMNNSVQNMFSGIVAFTIYTACSVIIVVTYTMFKFTSSDYAPMQAIGACTIIITAFSLKAALVLAIYTNINSKDCCDVGRTARRKEEGLYWKAQKPISARVGDQFKLETMDYILVVFGDIILKNIVDLLVAF